MWKKLVAVATAVMMLICAAYAVAENAEGQNAWVLRRQCDNVLIQKSAGVQPYEYKRLWDNNPPCGAEIYLTGNRSGKWLECIALYLPEHPTGWIHEGFVVTNEPRECGLIATVVKPVTVTESIGGRAAWECVRGDKVKVLYRTDEWCTTIWGVIQTDALDFNISGDVTQPRRAGWRDWTKRDHILCVVDWGL